MAVGDMMNEADMMVQVKCVHPNCGYSIQTDGKRIAVGQFVVDEEFHTCNECESPTVVHGPDTADASALLYMASGELENANAHSKTALPKELFYAIAPLVHPEQHQRLARAIYDVILKDL